jgi:hypothetical protein
MAVRLRRAANAHKVLCPYAPLPLILDKPKGSEGAIQDPERGPAGESWVLAFARMSGFGEGVTLSAGRGS